MVCKCAQGEGAAPLTLCGIRPPPPRHSFPYLCFSKTRICFSADAPHPGVWPLELGWRRCLCERGLPDSWRAGRACWVKALFCSHGWTSCCARQRLGAELVSPGQREPGPGEHFVKKIEVPSCIQTWKSYWEIPRAEGRPLQLLSIRSHSCTVQYWRASGQLFTAGFLHCPETQLCQLGPFGKESKSEWNGSKYGRSL